MRYLFVADMHLMPGPRPEQNEALRLLLNSTAASADAIVFIGDLFHCWFERSGRHVGDYEEVIQLLHETSKRGVALHYIGGNRDFTIGRHLEDITGGTVHGLGWNTIIGGKRLRLVHGDSFCTRDSYFMLLRWLLTGPIGRVAAGLTPWPVADKIVSHIQSRPKLPFCHTPYAEKDLQNSAAAADLAHHDAEVIICGHRHEPDKRFLENNGHKGVLHVVPAWLETRQHLEFDGYDFRLMPS